MGYSGARGKLIREKLEAENLVSDLYKYDVAYVLYVVSAKTAIKCQ
jgi:hypothetical protein